MKLDKHTKALLSDPDSRWAWIKYQLQLRGRSIADVAREAGVTRQCLYHAAVTTYPRSEKVIADALGMEPKDLFPERYDQASGLPHYRMGRPVGAKTKRRGKSVSKNSTKGNRRNISASARDEYKDAA